MFRVLLRNFLDLVRKLVGTSDFKEGVVDIVISKSNSKIVLAD